MDEKKEVRQILTDEQIVTERKIPRRSFLTAAGAFLAGAAALVAAARSEAGEGEPQASDPDKKAKKSKAHKGKMGKMGKMGKKGKKAKAADPDKAK